MSSPAWEYRPELACLRFTADAPLEHVYERDPEVWVDDTRWHLHMYRRANFRWAPEDPVAIALNYAHGRSEFTTHNHLHSLTKARRVLHGFNRHFHYQLMRRVLFSFDVFDGSEDGRAGLNLIGLTGEPLMALVDYVTDPPSAYPQTEFARALHGFPFPNPFTEAWEIIQIKEMYEAAELVLEDTAADLTNELLDRNGWKGLDEALELEVDDITHWLHDHMAARGLPGDPRRITKDPMKRR